MRKNKFPQNSHLQSTIKLNFFDYIKIFSFPANCKNFFQQKFKVSAIFINLHYILLRFFLYYRKIHCSNVVVKKSHIVRKICKCISEILATKRTAVKRSAKSLVTVKSMRILNEKQH